MLYLFHFRYQIGRFDNFFESIINIATGQDDVKVGFLDPDAMNFTKNGVNIQETVA